MGAELEGSSATGVNGDQTDNSATYAGAAYVFVRSGTTWSQQAYLKASNTGAGDHFGTSVSVTDSGDTLVVGAFLEDSTAKDSGAAYVFVRSGTTWKQQAHLKASKPDMYDRFGLSVAISVSGDTVVVGAPNESGSTTGVNGNESDNGTLKSGAAYVFVRSGTKWSQQSYLKASNTGPEDAFGWRVSVSGGTIVVTAQREDSSATGVDGNQTNDSSYGFDSGAAYVFVGPPPSPGLSAKVVSSTRVDLAWTDDSTLETGFTLERKTDGGVFTVLASLGKDVVTYIDAGLSAQAIYTYRVRAGSANGPSDWSNEATVTTGLVPTSDLSALAVTETRIDLAWTDLSPGEAAWEVERRNDTKGGAFELLDTLPADSGSYVDEGVSAETTHSYRVRPVNAGFAASWSNEVVVTTQPKAPTGLDLDAASDIQVLVRWNDLSAAEAGYEVERREVGGTFFRIGTVQPDYRAFFDDTVTGQSVYTYRVRAFNQHGSSGFTEEGSVKTPPTAPSGLAGEVFSPSVIRLIWTDNSPGEDGFRIERRELTSEEYDDLGIVASDTTEFTDTTAVQENEYFYRVSAYDPAGTSGYAHSLGLTTPAVLILGKAKLKNGTLTLTGEFDTGPDPIDLTKPATLTVGDLEIAIPGFSVEKKGKLLRYEGDGIVLDLIPAKSGSSRVAFKLKAAVDLDPDGELDIRFASGTYNAMGAARLSGGQLNPKKGLGRVLSPTVQVLQVKGKLSAGNAALKVKALFASFDPLPGTTPDVSIAVRTYTVEFVGTDFSGTGTKRKLKIGNWKVTLDLAKGTLTASGKGLFLGSFHEGPQAMKLSVQVGDRVYKDLPVVAVTKSALVY